MTDVRGLDRRGMLRLAAAVAGSAAFAGLAIAEVDAELQAIKGLKPGQWFWYPERAPDGFVAVVVSLPDQRCYVYRNGLRIGVSTVSTGKDGHLTPTGVFTILGKDVDHHSSLYNDASMPYTERLTWSGVALHAGGLPGYPSSHGCVHLPLAFAKLLFSITHVGTPVIIADAHSAPESVLQPGLVMPEALDQTLAVDAVGQGTPGAGEPVSAVISGADKKIVVLRGAQTVLDGSVTVKDPSLPLGNTVYVLADAKGAAPRWTVISYEGGGVGAGAPQQALGRIDVDPAINRQLASLMVPGATLLITDLPAHPGTRSDGGFVVMTPRGPSA